MLYKFGRKVSHFAFFCMEEPEIPIHLFYSCTKTNFLQTQLQHSFRNVPIIPPITPQSAIFGFTDLKVNYHMINHIPLIFKYYVYKLEKMDHQTSNFKRNIHKIKIIEKQISLSKSKIKTFLNKNGNHCQKTHSTYFEIYRGATVGWGKGNVVVFSSICYYFLYQLRYCSALKTDMLN